MTRRWVQLGVALMLFLIGGGVVAFMLLRTFMPARTLDLVGSSWSVAAIGPQSRVEDIEATLEFRSTGEAILQSDCGRRTLGFDIDGDDTGLSLWLLSSDLRDCPAPESQLEAALVEDLNSTTHWVVQSDTAIQLRGQNSIGLIR